MYSSVRAARPLGPIDVLTARLSTGARYACAAALVGVTTGMALLLLQHTGDTRLSMIFLGGILVTGVFLGSGPAYMAAGACFLIYNFFLVEPRFTLTMQTPEDLMTLLMFTVTAGLTSSLAGRIRDQTQEARARARATAALYDATHEFSASSDETFIRQRLARHLAAAARGAALVREGFSMHVEPAGVPIEPQLIRDLDAAQKTAPTVVAASIAAADGWTLRPMRLGDASLGVAAWRTADGVLAPDELTLLDILVDAGATAILRTRLAAAKGDAETKARTEDLRNALLSSISHDMRTPLAAIMASAGSLRRYSGQLDEATRTDLATNIEEEATRLDESVANLLNMACLESGQLAVRRVRFDPLTVIEKTLAASASSASGVRLLTPDPVGDVTGDPLLFQQALGNVVENARRYAPRGKRVDVSVERRGKAVTVAVVDEGPGVDPADLPRIFEKFFRAGAALDQRGTGLGLAIARGLMEGMGGAIAAANRDDGQSGLAVRLQLKAAP